MLLIDEEHMQHETLYHKEMAKAKAVPHGITSSLIVSNISDLQRNGGGSVVNE